MPLGQGTLAASWTAADSSGTVLGNAKVDNVDADQFAIGYVYNLSKRTAMYATYSRIDNDDGARFTVSGRPAVPASQKSGFSSDGYEFGVRHAF